MKYIQLTIFTFCLSSFAFSQGIEFVSIDFKGALDKASQEQKLIFVDAYTTWCGPCKWMNKNVFGEEKVGNYYNENFVNIKLDMEKGEGIEFAKNYKVNVYPTLLFINGKGEMIHISKGGRPADDFIDLGMAANDPDRQITTMTKRYEGGEKSGDFLMKYADAMTSAGVKNFEEITQLYMDQQEDWNSEKNMNFLFDYSEASMDSKLFQYMMINRTGFETLVGKDKFDQKVNYAAERDRTKSGIARDDIAGLTLHYGKYYSVGEAKQKAMVSYFNQTMYSSDPLEQEKFYSEIQLFLASAPNVGSTFYNAVAWQIYELSEDKDLLQKASEWAKKSIDEKKSSFNTDTMAALLVKLGKLNEARIYAMESISLAKEEGNDFSATEELLKKIDMK